MKRSGLKAIALMAGMGAMIEATDKEIFAEVSKESNYIPQRGLKGTHPKTDLNKRQLKARKRAKIAHESRRVNARSKRAFC